MHCLISSSATLLFLLSSCLSTSYTIRPTLAVAPTIDYSHNMRILKLPKSTQVGELIYRLKGSDGDAQNQLVFGVSGIEARQLLDVVPVSKSWNEADVYLRAPLTSILGDSSSTTVNNESNEQQQQLFNLTLFVSDGNKTTTVDSTILITNDDELFDQQAENLPSSDSHQIALDASTNFTQQRAINSANSLSPFLKPTKQVFLVPENSQPGEAIGVISVRESSTSELPVRFELRGKGSEHFGIKYVFGPSGQSRGQLELAQPVDYERQNLYALKVLALNAWTNTRLDTRNVASLDILIAVGDVQDTGPIFSIRSPRLLRISNEMQPGDIVDRVEAQDGDLADQRPIAYALDAGSMLANRYFDIHNTTGVISLKRSASELSNALGQASSIPQQDQQALVVFASELPDKSSYEHLWPPMFARLELPILMVDTRNEPPHFYGGWQTQEPLRLGGQPVLHGYLREPSGHQQGPSYLTSKLADSQEQQVSPLLVHWFTNLTQAQLNIGDETIRSLVVDKARGQPIVIDSGQGLNGTFELSLEGQDAHLFEIEPEFAVVKQTQFSLRVAPQANRSLFDRDLYHQDQVRSFQFDIVATDFGSAKRQTSRIKCLIELLDSNDHWPAFERDSYTFQVYESAPPGQLLGSVRAHDKDSPNGSSSNSRIRYTSLTGKEAHLFHLDRESGLITLVGSLDREKQSQYLMLAEACDQYSACNYTKIFVNVLDVNDNGPIFAQSHYDAMLRPDGRFETPLIVHASDADEPNSANSQLAYEILAGNQRDLFSIDSLSGEIFLNDFRPSTTIQLPSILGETISPHSPNSNNNNNQRRPLDLAGKVLPNENGKSNREVEETTTRQPLRLNWPPIAARSIDTEAKQSSSSSNHRQSNNVHRVMPSLDLNEHMPAIDLLLNLDSDSHNLQARSIRGVPTAADQNSINSAASSSGSKSPTQFEAYDLPPVISLVIRAHDFGIPIRSATCKVNIYNQALQSRWLSLILNGTVAELLERRDQIERSFGALTGSRAQIDSLDALSDSSSLSVARMRLIMPSGHQQLVDLTDLSGLMQALDMRPVAEQQRQAAGGTNQQAATPIVGPTYIIPTHHGLNSNLSSISTGSLPHGFFTDSQINSFAMDSNALEKKLLIYIIIVGVCILALLLIWLIYSCCHEDKVIKLVEKPSRYYSRRVKGGDSLEQLEESGTEAKRKGYKQRDSIDTKAKQFADSSNHAVLGSSAINNNLAKQQKHLLSVDSATKIGQQNQRHLSMNALKSDHLSMYNGQVWFEPANGAGVQSAGANSAQDANSLMLLDANSISERDGKTRASSAPIHNSLDSALHAAIGSAYPAGSVGQHAPNMPAGSSNRFFPNAQGYVDNLAALNREPMTSNGFGIKSMDKRARRRKVAPMEERHKEDSFETDQDKHRHRHQHRHSNHESNNRRAHHSSSTRSCTSASSLSDTSGSCTSDSHRHHHRRDSVVLESDQELLGFDSTGTPIIATHTSARKPAGDLSSGGVSIARPQVFKAPAGATSYLVPLSGDTVMTHEEMTRVSKGGNTVQRSEVSKPKSEPAKASGKKASQEIVQKQDSMKKAIEISDDINKEVQSEQNRDEERQKVDANSHPDEINRTLNQMTDDQPQKQLGRQRTGLIRQSAEAVSILHKELAEPRDDQKPEDQKKLEEEDTLTSEQQVIAKEGKGSQESRQTVFQNVENIDSKKASLNKQQSTMSEDSTISLNQMKNRELLEKQSIFAMTYSGLATDKLSS